MLRSESAPTQPERYARAPVMAAMPAPSNGGWGNAPTAVELYYTERARILVRGPQSGLTYEFSTARPVQTVAAADVAPLLRTGFFRRR
ncbi:MAG: hypothetical protein ACREF3_17070 [Acetobacteraceae bacterium]